MVIFIAWIVFILSEQKTNLNHIKICENKGFFNVVMPFEDTKVLEFNKWQKYDKVIFLIYAGLESFIEKIDGCKNNPEKHLWQK